MKATLSTWTLSGGLSVHIRKIFTDAIEDVPSGMSFFYFVCIGIVDGVLRFNLTDVSPLFAFVFGLVAFVSLTAFTLLLDKLECEWIMGDSDAAKLLDLFGRVLATAVFNALLLGVSYLPSPASSRLSSFFGAILAATLGGAFVIFSLFLPREHSKFYSSMKRTWLSIYFFCHDLRQARFVAVIISFVTIYEVDKVCWQYASGTITSPYQLSVEVLSTLCLVGLWIHSFQNENSDAALDPRISLRKEIIFSALRYVIWMIIIFVADFLIKWSCGLRMQCLIWYWPLASAALAVVYVKLADWFWKK